MVDSLLTVGQTNVMNNSTFPFKSNSSDFNFAAQSSNKSLPALQSSSDIKQRLDSIITAWPSSGSKQKTHFLYNSEGYNTKCINYSFDENVNKWVQSGNVKCDYDSAWNLTSFVTDGEYKRKEEYTYDKAGNLITVTYFQYDKSTGWYEIFKNEFNYDRFPYEVDAILPFAEYCTIRFDDNGKIINVKWIGTDSLDFQYDIYGNILSRTRFFYDPGYCPFVVMEKEDYY